MCKSPFRSSPNLEPVTLTTSMSLHLGSYRWQHVQICGDSMWPTISALCWERLFHNIECCDAVDSLALQPERPVCLSAQGHIKKMLLQLDWGFFFSTGKLTCAALQSDLPLAGRHDYCNNKNVSTFLNLSSV